MNDTPSPAPSQGSQVGGANGEALPRWPDVDAPEYFAGWDYEHAMSLAWEARARVALAALKTAQIEAGGCSYEASRDFAQMALQSTESICSLAIYAIGPLPSPKEQRT